jgi:hypothetical protein
MPAPSPEATVAVSQAAVNLIEALSKAEIARLEATVSEREAEREERRKDREARRAQGREAWKRQREKRERETGQGGLFPPGACGVKRDPWNLNLKAEQILAHNEGRCSCTGANGASGIPSSPTPPHS